MTSAIFSDDASPDRPVSGATEFIGRTRFAQNLLSRCLRRQSILLYGGPKLGKTSLLLQLRWLADQERTVDSSTPATVYLDLADENVRHRLLSERRINSEAILLLDNCEALISDNCAGRLREFLNEAIGHAIVWAGGRSWHDWALDQAGAAKLQSAPLAVFLQGEAQELLKPDLTPHQFNTALQAGGTHPYVLKVVAHALQACPTNPERAISMASERLFPFFRACRDGMREPFERTLFEYLAKEARPVSPGEAARAIGDPSVKRAADVLCWLGLISRWNLNEGAMLQAGSRLFNDWYLTAAC
jgi:hypothetical protein